VIWRFDLPAGESMPFSAWYGAGGSGVWLHLAPNCSADERRRVREATAQWERETGRRVWLAGV
jgi:hypothetical protein